MCQLSDRPHIIETISALASRGTDANSGTCPTPPTWVDCTRHTGAQAGMGLGCGSGLLPLHNAAFEGDVRIPLASAVRPAALRDNQIAMLRMDQTRTPELFPHNISGAMPSIARANYIKAFTPQSALLLAVLSSGLAL